jgi:hypothetical protein
MIFGKLGQPAKLESFLITTHAIFLFYLERLSLFWMQISYIVALKRTIYSKAMSLIVNSQFKWF